MENTNVRQEEIRSRFFGELSLQLREMGVVSERKGANILCVSGRGTRLRRPPYQQRLQL